MTGVAEKATSVPAQTGLADAAIETLTGIKGFTVMEIVLEVAGFPVVQVSPEVRIQVSKLAFDGVKEYVALVAPMILDPFNFHW